MYSYRAYGLHIRSVIALPELEGYRETDPDVAIERRVLRGPLPPNEFERLVQFDEQGAYLAWRSIGRFRVDQTGKIGIDPLTENENLIRRALLGPVLAALLHQRKMPLLHGSAVAANGRALLFLGPNGAGKSTLAAAFAANGCDMLNDDIIALLANPSQVSIVAGFPSLKLSSAAKDALIPNGRIVRSPEPGSDSKMMVSGKNTTSGTLAISDIFVIDGRDGTPAIDRLSSPIALKALLANSYALKFGDGALAGPHGARLFEVCAMLARDVAISHIRPPSEFQCLRAFASSIIQTRHSGAATG